MPGVGVGVWPFWGHLPPFSVTDGPLTSHYSILLHKRTHKVLPMNKKARPSFMKITGDKSWGMLTLKISPHRLSALMWSRLGARAEWVPAGQLQTSFPDLAQIWGTS